MDTLLNSLQLPLPLIAGKKKGITQPVEFILVFPFTIPKMEERKSREDLVR